MRWNEPRELLAQGIDPSQAKRCYPLARCRTASGSLDLGVERDP